MDHAASEPGVGPIITIPDVLLSEFNTDVEKHGGIIVIKSFL
ncbi:MAG: hypothetical protein ACKE51_08475 [Methylococcaceae bacterium]